jgi:hypothetical protein
MLIIIIVLVIVHVIITIIVTIITQAARRIDAPVLPAEDTGDEDIEALRAQLSQARQEAEEAGTRLSEQTDRNAIMAREVEVDIARVAEETARAKEEKVSWANQLEEDKERLVSKEREFQEAETAWRMAGEQQQAQAHTDAHKTSKNTCIRTRWQTYTITNFLIHARMRRCGPWRQSRQRQ